MTKPSPEPVSLYRTVMGDTFARLAPALQQFHRLSGRVRLTGYVEVEPPSSFTARLLARCLRAPLESSRGPLSFELAAEPGTETWTRHFPGRTMASCLASRHGELVEKLGAAQLTFSLEECKGQLKMRLQRMSFCGITCPRWLLPEVTAVETGDKRKLRFQVEARVRRVGLVASYRGWLDLRTVERLEPALA